MSKTNFTTTAATGRNGCSEKEQPVNKSKVSRKQLEEFVLASLPAPSVDIRFENHGSIILIRGVSDAGQAWLDENVGNDETQYFGNAIAAEPRYCLPLYEGAVEAGLVCR